MGLPAELRFEGDAFRIRRDPETGKVILSPLNESFADWLDQRNRLRASMTEQERKEMDEFLADRDQGENVERAFARVPGLAIQDYEHA